MRRVAIQVIWFLDDDEFSGGQRSQRQITKVRADMQKWLKDEIIVEQFESGFCYRDDSEIEVYRIEALVEETGSKGTTQD